eukprot:scaffold126_cov71-Phaeocystis_antarctica.AAC.2
MPSVGDSLTAARLLYFSHHWRGALLVRRLTSLLRLQCNRPNELNWRKRLQCGGGRGIAKLGARRFRLSAMARVVCRTTGRWCRTASAFLYLSIYLSIKGRSVCRNGRRGTQKTSCGLAPRLRKLISSPSPHPSTRAHAARASPPQGNRQRKRVNDRWDQILYHTLHEPTCIGFIT